MVVPLGILALVELVLRLSGFGHPTTFFIPETVRGERVLVENPWFGLRFFPPTASRSPSPVVLRPEKPAGVYRIFLLGESAALGDPRPAYGMGRYLEVLLRERYPEARFEVICVAVTAISSHALLPIARECARYAGDLWIVYAGHNEMVGPFGAATVFTAQAPRVTWVRTMLALQTLRTGQAVLGLARWLGPGREAEAGWGGMKMFLNSQLPPDDPRKDRVRRNFRRNLEDVVRVGLKAGAQVLLCTPACNLRDCPPFASLHGSRPPADPAAWNREMERGIQAQAEGRSTEAITAFQAASRQGGEFAELQYRLASAHRALTNLGLARTGFELARDCDALPFRADGALQGAVMEVAGQYAGRGVHRLDATAVLAEAAPDRIPGVETFFEHVHLNFEGNYRLARAMAEQMVSLLPSGIRAGADGGWAGPDVCALRLGLSDWNRRAVYENVLGRLAEAPFTNQLAHAERVGFLASKVRDLNQKLQGVPPASVRSNYVDALRRAPDDFRLHECYGEFLGVTGHYADAADVWRNACVLVPHHYLAHFELGRNLARVRDLPAARRALERSIELRPDYADAHLELGQVLVAQGHAEEGLSEYAIARRLQPGDARIYVQAAHVLAELKRRDEALVSLREAIRLRPTYWQARYYLGVELAVDGKNEEALAQFALVTRLKPDFALGHLNLGTALARQRRFAEAAAQFEETLKLDPENALARHHLQTLSNAIRTNAIAPPPGL